MSGYNPESIIADGADYIGFAYLPQLITQSLENGLARGDLNKAINAKCGSAGASNAADLEKQLLASDPMSPNRFGFRTSDSNTWRFRFPFTQRQIPFFWGPRNPFLLTWGAAHNIEAHQLALEQANKIKDPTERQKALEAIGNKDLYWAGAETGAAFLLADYNRGLSITSRMPLLSRLSALGSNSPYQQLLKEVTGKIKCNGDSSDGPGAKAPDPETVASAEPAAAQAAAPAPAIDPAATNLMSMDPDVSANAVAFQMCTMDFVTENAPTTNVIPDSALIPMNAANLARDSLAMFARNNPSVSGVDALNHGVNVTMGNPALTIVAPTTFNYTVAPLTGMVKPISAMITARPFILETAAFAE